VGGRLKIANEPIKLLIRAAFQLQNAQIAGGPPWLESDRYDIEARTGRPEKPNPSELTPLLQNLLADRFHLKFHRETRELPVSALIVAKSGPRLNPPAEGESAGMSTHTGKGSSQVVATASPMSMLAGYISNRLGQIVVDQTGLTSVYDFTLEWSPEETTDSPHPSLVTALREQLGLTLESRKAAIQVLVIDNLQRPTEN
jgi:uncharacterized protein (TIGR03435 family)